MDITFEMEEGKFNYRVCAIIIHEEKLLAMKDYGSPYYYLPGGRVQLHQTAEEAVVREVKEELEIESNIIRPLWLNQSFFIQDIAQERYHELCFYFLMDVSNSDLISRGNKFLIDEGEEHHSFQWIPFEKLSETYLYPNFIKKEIYNLPKSLVMITEGK